MTWYTAVEVFLELWSDIKQSILPNAAINCLSELAVAVTSAEMCGISPEYDLRRLFIVGRYFKLLSLAGIMFRVSVCTSSSRRWLWSCVESGELKLRWAHMILSGDALKVPLSLLPDTRWNPSYWIPTSVTHPDTPHIHHRTRHVLTSVCIVNIEKNYFTKFSSTDTLYNRQLQR